MILLMCALKVIHLLRITPRRRGFGLSFRILLARVMTGNQSSWVIISVGGKSCYFTLPYADLHFPDDRYCMLEKVASVIYFLCVSTDGDVVSKEGIEDVVWKMFSEIINV